MIVRKPLRKFMRDCERVLRDNDYKGGWTKCDRKFLLDKLDEEVAELREEVEGRGVLTKFEACDVANIAMMIYDNFR